MNTLARELKGALRVVLHFKGPNYSWKEVPLLAYKLNARDKKASSGPQFTLPDCIGMSLMTFDCIRKMFSHGLLVSNLLVAGLIPDSGQRLNFPHRIERVKVVINKSRVKAIITTSILLMAKT